MSNGDGEHYRKQAEMCRDQASLRSSDPATRDLSLKLAVEYEQLADTAARTERAPTDQQQQKKKDE